MSDFQEKKQLAIDDAMLADRFRLRRTFRRLRQRPDAKKLAHAEERLEKSIQLVDSRKRSVPPIVFGDNLPVNQKRDEIRQAILNNQTTIVCGETGSGKSTQLPKICLEAGFGCFGTIGHTQPRRIAARSVAARVAEELNCELGKQVGYKVRFNDLTSAGTLIKLMTDGILLAETQVDRFLESYDALIIDEAHERSLNIDFLLGFLKTLLPRRPEFRLIITSATIDAERFSTHFRDSNGPAPVVEVSGRSYPVETIYRPVEGDSDYFDGINEAVIELLKTEPGDILIFLPTEKDIRTAAKKLRGLDFLKRGQRTEILPLYARLSVAEQNRIFRPDQSQRIVLATNVAESSLTVPRIKYVIDTGLARISRYSSRSKIQRLPIEKISQASANQRAGRCGRLGPGVCVRLFDEDDFATRDAFTTPEIRRTNLASVILQAKSMHFGDVDRIQFLDPPRPDSIRDGYKTLFEISATDNNRDLTKIGHQIKHFPCDPRISRMILAGDEEGVLADVLVIAAALEVQDVRDRPIEKQQQADQAHEKFKDSDSDFMTLLNIWDFYHEQKSNLSNSQLRKSLQQNFLSFVRIREWLDIYRQLKDLCLQQKIKIGRRKNLYDSIHRALLTGMLSGVATKGDKYEYEGAGGTRFFLWPGSGLIDQSPRWILGTEVVETSKRYIRNVAKIQTQWIEPLAKHLVHKTQSDPFWHEKSEKVMSNEKVSLFGLTIIPRRMVPYAKCDPAATRQIFIEEALVNARLPVRHKFQSHNAAMIQQVKDNVAKTRDRNLIIDDLTIFAFYDKRIPESVFDGVSLRKWIKEEPGNDSTLCLSLDDLVENDESKADDFPDAIATQSLKLELDYAFEPGAEKDGITTTVPAVALSQLNAARLDWLVPGFLPQKIESLIRSLPKSKRRWFAPIPQTAQKVAENIEFAKGDFRQSVARELTRIAEEPIDSIDFDNAKVDYHLQMNIEVTDEQGLVIDSGRNLFELQEKHCQEDQAPSLGTDIYSWNQTGLVDWEFGDLPEMIPVSHGGMEIKGYPAIIDEGNAVGLRVVPSQQLARQETEFGIARLAGIRTSKSIRKQLKWIPDLENFCVIATQISSVDKFKSGLADLIARRAFVDIPETLPTTTGDFETLLSNAIEYISMASQDVATMLPKFFEQYQKMNLALAGQTSDWAGDSISALKTQLDQLLTEGFWLKTPWTWLTRFPIYFRSIMMRLEKLNRQNINQDLQIESTFQEHFKTYQEIANRHRAQGMFDQELIHYRFMIEEFRVSTFSQQLGTAIPVSEKRLQKQIAKLA